MTRFLFILCVVVFVADSVTLSGQWICIGKDGRPCTPEELKDAVAEICREEKAPPNLSVSKPVRLAGTLRDETGAFVDFDKEVPGTRTIVQIRDAEKGTVLFESALEKGGQFQFGSIPAGSFRLVAIWTKDNKVKRLPLADQPRTMSCTEATECRVDAVIHFHGTDNPIDMCPPK